MSQVFSTDAAMTGLRTQYNNEPDSGDYVSAVKYLEGLGTAEDIMKAMAWAGIT